MPAWKFGSPLGLDKRGRPYHLRRRIAPRTRGARADATAKAEGAHGYHFHDLVERSWSVYRLRTLFRNAKMVRVSGSYHSLFAILGRIIDGKDSKMAFILEDGFINKPSPGERRDCFPLEIRCQYCNRFELL